MIPFKYLGLPVGANRRKVVTWQPVIDALNKRLGAWKNRHLSMGGKVVLLNSVLSVIRIYFLSYLKMLASVRKVVRIQREFLWGGGGVVKGVRKIP